MAPSQPVSPLRVVKNPSSTPQGKLPSAMPRPLSEISPSEKRRNSPSWHQITGKPTLSDSSPFQSSPVDSASSPRLFWKNQNINSENDVFGARGGSPSSTRRSSLERLQRASRVKNSNILALEHRQDYDPARLPTLERPLSKLHGNSFNPVAPASRNGKLGHHRNESKTTLPLMEQLNRGMVDDVFEDADISLDSPATHRSPNKELTGSPIKSSLSVTRFKSSYDADFISHSRGLDFEDMKLSARLAKSVTFDAAPPQVNEYAPDLSSVGSDSRQGSYESTDEDYDERHGLPEMDCLDDSFDASLEDTEKTPVVGPDEWRHGSPATHSYFGSADRDESDKKLHEGSLMPEALAHVLPRRNLLQRTDSGASNEEHRPLPPLPGGKQTSGGQSGGSAGSSTNTEKIYGLHRDLPSPPPPSGTKFDDEVFGGSKMTLEERLKIIMSSDDGAKTAAEEQRERRLRRAGNRDRFSSPMDSGTEPDIEMEQAQTIDSSMLQENEGESDTLADLSVIGDCHLPAKISRESIMRRVDGNMSTEQQCDYSFASHGPSSLAYGTRIPLDPDIPIPSTENSDPAYSDDDAGSVIINRDNTDDPEDACDDYPDVSQLSENDQEDDGSLYSNETKKASRSSSRESSSPQPTSSSLQSNPLPGIENLTLGDSEHPQLNAFLPSFEDFTLNDIAESRGLSDASNKSTGQNPEILLDSVHDHESNLPPQHLLIKPDYDGSSWGNPEDEFDRSGTPESVIYHPKLDDQVEDVDCNSEPSPSVPEQIATIKASGSKLKTRLSATPSDLLAMREARRQVSNEIGVPPIPERHRNRMSRDMDAEIAAASNSQEDDEFIERHPSFKSRSLKLDLEPGLCLDRDFERVIESQKRGYLMRQNTKLVAASDLEGEDRWKTRSAGSSPVKQDRPLSWTVEPWNGETRPRSQRKRTVGPSGPVPPLPGQESNTSAAISLGTLSEEELAAETAVEDGGERGRLFVKVMGVKDLDLPLPGNERTWFSLTLDNGVHCVTTAWLELARNAPIGQEFELVVPNDLEFQLTLNVKLEKPAPVAPLASPTKTTKYKTSTLSRVFGSPRKRRELELRQREEEQAQQQREATVRAQLSAGPSAWDLLSPLAAEDGSFARAYVCLKEHESRCFGRPYMTDLACFNEWATEEAVFASSVKSKRGTSAVIRRAPYKVGKLELQLLFVPRPSGATAEDMPKSMNACIRELKAAEERLSICWEGILSQHGGDCPYWRRRFFKLNGTTLTAYHESTRQIRATINLYNAKRLIDDRRSLMERETIGRGGRRRRSAFAEEEDGYMFVEEGFRIRFNNGEVIDFYADTAEDKESWMRALSEVVGRSSGGPASNVGLGEGTPAEAGAPGARGKWCDLVLKREEGLRRRTDERKAHSRSRSMYG